MIPAASPASGEVGGVIIQPEERKSRSRIGIPKALGVGGHPLQTGKVGGKIILLLLRSWESQPGLSSQLKHGSGGGFSHPDSSLRAHTAGKSIPKALQGCQHSSRSREPGSSQRGAQNEQSMNPLLPKAAQELTQGRDSVGSWGSWGGLESSA